MILKLFFIQICVAFMPSVSGYVLFAANIDDFRSLAKRIIPDRLADQLADMASKSGLNYRKEKQPEEINEGDKADTRDDHQKKRFTVKNDIDLDELVKRVKEKLEKEYQAQPNVNDDSPVGKTPTIDDYYYKDDTMNLGDAIQDYTEGGEVYQRPSGDQAAPDYDEDEANNAQYDNQHNVKAYNSNAQAYAQSNMLYKQQGEVLRPQPNDEEENIQVQLYSEENAKAPQYGKENAHYDDDYNSPYNENVNTGKYNTYNAPVDQYNLKYNDKVSQYNQEEPAPFYTVKTTKSAQNAMNYEAVNTNYDINKVKSANIFKGATHVSEEVEKVPVYYEDDKDIEAKENDGELLKEVDLRNIRDSYEDYVTPEKDDIFESEEKATKTTKATRQAAKVKLMSSDPKSAYQKAKITEEKFPNRTEATREITTLPTKPESGEGKAKTESLWYDEHYDETTTQAVSQVGDVSTKPTKKLKGTMIPTREYFKMSSPNYYGKIKAVAEKYNFDEPLPEKDREPEIIKEIGNPPATINKKVKLNL